MELIIKTTAACNMACKFCAAAGIKTIEQKSVDPRIIDIIKTIKPNGIILTGGDSLCCSPEWYYELFELFPDIQVDFVTNLKDYYLNPDKWTDIFRRKNEPIYLAGLYKEDHFVIITKEASGVMKDIHSRMPLILEAKDVKNYLLGDNFFDSIFMSNNPPLRKEICL